DGGDAHRHVPASRRPHGRPGREPRSDGSRRREGRTAHGAATPNEDAIGSRALRLFPDRNPRCSCSALRYHEHVDRSEMRRTTLLALVLVTTACTSEHGRAPGQLDGSIGPDGHGMADRPFETVAGFTLGTPQSDAQAVCDGIDP